MLHHLRGSLPAVPKKNAKALRRTKFVVPDIEDEPLSDILLLHVNQRITAALRTAGSNITWEWATKDPLSIVKGGRALLNPCSRIGRFRECGSRDGQAGASAVRAYQHRAAAANPYGRRTRKAAHPAETPPLPDPRIWYETEGPYSAGGHCG